MDAPSNLHMFKIGRVGYRAEESTVIGGVGRLGPPLIATDFLDADAV
jgi:hypothetical protein